MTRVAVCHWGLLRTIETTYESHKKHMYGVLDRAGIQYDTYVHTWFHESTPRLKLDAFKFKKLVMDDETEVFEQIDRDFSEYWYAVVYNANGGEDSLNEWNPVMLKRHLYSLVSQKRVTQMCLDSGVQYDYVIYIRPDIELSNDIDCRFAEMDADTIYLSTEQWGSTEYVSENDAFGIVPFSKCVQIGMRFDEAKMYRKNVGRLAPEHFCGSLVYKYFTKILHVDQKLRIARL